MGMKTNIEVVRYASHVWKDGKGYYIFIAAKAMRSTFTNIRAYITDLDDIARLDSIYKKEKTE